MKLDEIDKMGEIANEYCEGIFGDPSTYHLPIKEIQVCVKAIIYSEINVTCFIPFRKNGNWCRHS